MEANMRKNVVIRGEVKGGTIILLAILACFILRQVTHMAVCAGLSEKLAVVVWVIGFVTTVAGSLWLLAKATRSEW
jgi:hypothetical protein